MCTATSALLNTDTISLYCVNVLFFFRALVKETALCYACLPVYLCWGKLSLYGELECLPWSARARVPQNC